jgi:hypothetical protein
MKGKENVLSEVNLIMMCYNLRRLMSVFNINNLKRLLQGVYVYYLSIVGLFVAVLRHYYLQTNFFNHKNLTISIPVQANYGKIEVFL